jgi:hypothetical protein
MADRKDGVGAVGMEGAGAKTSPELCAREVI